MKKGLTFVISLIVFIIIITLFYLSSISIDVEAIKEKFANCIQNNNVVLVWEDRFFYFPEHELEIERLLPKDVDVSSGGWLFYGNKLYFTAVKSKNGDVTLMVYECDFDGSNLQLIFEKDGYKTGFVIYGNEDTFYIRHYEKNSFITSGQIIDSYNIVTGEYKTVAIGKDVSINSYKPDTVGRYSFAHKDDTVTITNTKTNKVSQITNEMLKSSEFGEALTDLNYSYVKPFVHDERIFLLYRLSGVKGNYPYPHFVCEYVPETHDLKFVLLAFPLEPESIDLAYINAD